MEPSGLAEDVPAHSVLLVDDDVPMRALLRLDLEASGRFAVVGEAGDGAAAVEAAGRLQPDLVLLDMAMPRMGGLEALPLIRAAAPGAAVVILSMMPAWQFEEQAKREGAVSCIDKGVDAFVLQAQLARLLGTLQAAASAPRETSSM